MNDARQCRTEHEPVVAQLARWLLEMMRHSAHLQIRNRGAMGGSLDHADPSTELPVIAFARDTCLPGQLGMGERWLLAKVKK